MIRAVLFDMDGVLTDSEQYICQAATEMFREKGITVVPDDFKPFTGMGENRYIGGVAEKYGLKVDIDEVKARTYAIYDRIVKGRLSPLDGVLSFIGKCREKKLKLAIATSADRIKMEINLREIGLRVSTFDAIVTGLDVVNKKPAPDIYLKAAELVGIDPANCLVVEDAVSGIKAGKRAGCKCLAVTTSFGRNELSEADWICDSLADMPDGALDW